RPAWGTGRCPESWSEQKPNIFLEQGKLSVLSRMESPARPSRKPGKDQAPPRCPGPWRYRCGRSTWPHRPEDPIAGHDCGITDQARSAAIVGEHHGFTGPRRAVRRVRPQIALAVWSSHGFWF